MFKKGAAISTEEKIDEIDKEAHILLLLEYPLVWTLLRQLSEHVRLELPPLHIFHTCGTSFRDHNGNASVC